MHKPYLISGLITCLIMLSISFAIDDPQQAHGTRIVGLIAATVILAAPIYNVNKWSLKRRTTVHFLAMTVCVLPLLMISGWYDWRSLGGLLMMVGVFVSFGIVGWMIGYIVNTLVERKNKSVHR